MTAGEICSNKVKIINNYFLYNVGYNIKIHNYVYTFVMNQMNWEMPCFDEEKEIPTATHLIQRNSIADIVEALIGACYSTHGCFVTTWEFIFNIKIVNKGKYK